MCGQKSRWMRRRGSSISSVNTRLPKPKKRQFISAIQTEHSEDGDSAESWPSGGSDDGDDANGHTCETENVDEPARRGRDDQEPQEESRDLNPKSIAVAEGSHRNSSPPEASVVVN
ncbi:hypothetical protein BDW02DRAFT_607227 [Decorospora gaudefroyi]|uniref:Uncharacterized protein n=1 Tax=Decorospora gaudefroyi TaxID=184978 RepID=A0A6A5KPJ1_9PLEO|nr:hypothetical protein BDW02DRAFT_607227 [Decorospora gaudefroyi]